MLSRFRVGVPREGEGLLVQRLNLLLPTILALQAVLAAGAVAYRDYPLAAWVVPAVAVGAAILLYADGWEDAPAPSDEIAAEAVRDVKGRDQAGAFSRVYEWRNVPRSAQGPFRDAIAKARSDASAAAARAKSDRQSQAAAEKRRAADVINEKAEGRDQR